MMLSSIVPSSSVRSAPRPPTPRGSLRRRCHVGADRRRGRRGARLCGSHLPRAVTRGRQLEPAQTLLPAAEKRNRPLPVGGGALVARRGRIVVRRRHVLLRRADDRERRGRDRGVGILSVSTRAARRRVRRQDAGSFLRPNVGKVGSVRRLVVAARELGIHRLVVDQGRVIHASRMSVPLPDASRPWESWRSWWQAGPVWCWNHLLGRRLRWSLRRRPTGTRRSAPGNPGGPRARRHGVEPRGDHPCADHHTH